MALASARYRRIFVPNLAIRGESDHTIVFRMKNELSLTLGINSAIIAAF